MLLSSGRVEYFSAAFYLRNRPGGSLEQDTLAIARERFVGPGLTEVVRVRNVGMTNVTFELSFAFGTDFADVISVKQHDFALGDPLHAVPLPPQVGGILQPGNEEVVLAEPDGTARTQVLLERPGEPWPEGVAFPGGARAWRELGAPARRRSVPRGRAGGAACSRGPLRHRASDTSASRWPRGA